MTDPPGSGRPPTSSYLPDLCTPVAVLGVVLVAELLAMALALARQDHWLDFFSDLGRTSVVLQWLSLTSAATLCLLRARAATMALRRGSALLLGGVMLNILVVSEAMYWVGYMAAPETAAKGWLPADHWFFAARNLAIGSIIAGTLLRYFYVSEQWRRNVRSQAETRIHALQARIRPHFLFNSMNTIASLIRSNPGAAEQAVEDLADLFRASLDEERPQITLAEDIEIARLYERMEQQRLGSRLIVEWQLGALPQDAMLPSLTIQPLLENAIYHGIERLTGSGRVRLHGERNGDMLSLTVTNPIPGHSETGRPGKQMALANIRERLELAFGSRANLLMESDGERFTTVLSFPYQRAAA